MIRVCPTIPEIPRAYADKNAQLPLCILLFSIMLLYILAAMIRLAYFNVEEEERQKKEEGSRKYFHGIPVTTAALLFPTILLLQYILPFDITLVYFVGMLVLGFAFLARIEIPKPGTKGVMIMVAIGIIEFLLLIIRYNFY